MKQACFNSRVLEPWDLMAIIAKGVKKIGGVVSESCGREPEVLEPSMPLDVEVFVHMARG